MFTLILLIAQGFAKPPVPIHGGARPCASHSIPSTDEGRAVACDAAGLPTLRIDPETRTVERDSAVAPNLPTVELVPPLMIGSVPAVTPHGVAWVSSERNGRRSLWWRANDGGLPVVLETGRTDPHHPVTDGDRVAWVSEGRITVYDPVLGTRGHIEANTGFNASPAFDRGVLCWETRSATDVDIECSTGRRLQRDGHQTRPVLIGNSLFFREDGLIWVWAISS